jgi:hypothetical protein
MRNDFSLFILRTLNNQSINITKGKNQLKIVLSQSSDSD